MWYIGIDLHRRMLVMAAVKDDGEVIDSRRIDCQDTVEILQAVEQLKPFRAAIEATGTYRWLYDLLSPHGSVLLAHPLRLRAMVQRLAKTDKLDAQLLANLLRIDQIPVGTLRQTHGRVRRTARPSTHRRSAGRSPAGHSRHRRLLGLSIIAKLGEVKRFRTAKQVGAYAGLTARVHQSGSHCYYGSINHEGSSWLRWVLVQAAMHVIRRDVALRNFHRRIRKRSSAKIARVATARKLAEICWKRLCR